MAPRHSWAVGIDETAGLITVEDARLSMSALWTPSGQATSRTGLVPATDEPGRVTASTPTPNGEIHVAPFRAVMQSGRGGGTYTWCLDEPETIDVLGDAPADPANPRIDLIVWQQSDTYFSDADSLLRIRHVVGTPAGAPVDPDVNGSDDHLLRARITVPAGATSLDDGDIEVLPLPWTVSTGGLLPIRDEAERDDITDPYPGMPIYRLDRDWAEVWDGTAWRVQGTAVCTSTADRDSAITDPINGQLAVTTDTTTVWVRRAGAWQVHSELRRTYTTGAIDTSFADASKVIGSVTIPNPGTGLSYMIESSIAGRLFMSAGRIVQVWLRNASGGARVSRYAYFANGFGGNADIPGAAVDLEAGPFSGSITLELYAEFTNPSGGLGYVPGTVDYLGAVVRVVPV